MTKEKVKIHFLGGAGDVTGSNFLFETTSLSRNQRFLIDCGMFQGGHENYLQNLHPFKFNPKEIKYLLLTHAHLDHCGRIPLLVKKGFRGEIITTAPTRDLTKLVLLDSAKVNEEEAKRK